MATITLKKLMQEGRLTLGDTLTHSIKGDYVLQRVCADGSLIVSKGLDVAKWKLKLPEGCTIVEVK